MWSLNCLCFDFHISAEQSYDHNKQELGKWKKHKSTNNTMSNDGSRIKNRSASWRLSCKWKTFREYGLLSLGSPKIKEHYFKIFEVLCKILGSSKIKIISSFFLSFYVRYLDWYLVNIEVGNLWNLCINRLSHIINWRCSEYNSTCSHYACQCKQPQKQPIQNHCNKFPILYYLLFF